MRGSLEASDDKSGQTENVIPLQSAFTNALASNWRGVSDTSRQVGTEPQRIDILSAISGVAYEDAVSRAVRIEIDGLSLKVIALDDLIANKRASGRSKDT